MSWAPLFGDGPVIPLHAFAAMTAILLGTVQVVAPKGTVSHVWIGRAWVAVMVFVALSSFLIHGFRMFGPFGPIHFLSLFVLWSVFTAVRDARRGAIREHRKTMLYLFSLALIVTGLFTLLPGRRMYEVLFGA